jgi:hypothetical protein
MLAFVLLDLTQGYPDAVVDHLTGIPEVVGAIPIPVTVICSAGSLPATPRSWRA